MAALSGIKLDMVPFQIMSILSVYDGKMSLQDLLSACKRFDVLPDGMLLCESSLICLVRDLCPAILEVDEDERSVGIVYPELQICVASPNKCLFRESCKKLHICRYFLNSTCQNGDQCIFVHSFFSSHNLLLLKKFNLDKYSEGVLKLIFQKKPKLESPLESTPKHVPSKKLQLCKYYNQGNCKTTNCSYLHMCSQYIEHECKHGVRCKKNHDINDQVKRVLFKFGISVKRPCHEIIALIQLHSSALQPSSSSQSAHYSAEDNKKDGTEICRYFLNLKYGCRFDEACKNHHKDLPYQWQYFSKRWKDFSDDSNTFLEQQFCNLKDNFLTEEDLIGGDVKISFDEMKGQSLKDQFTVNIRRLSTKSSVVDTASPVATEWKWYWENDLGTWDEYGENKVEPNIVASLTSKEIEKEYAEDPGGKIEFQICGHKYCLDFKMMEQNNLRKRKVCRRPVYVSRTAAIAKRNEPVNSLRAKKGHPGHNVPPYWKISDFTDINIELTFVTISSSDFEDEYSKVEKQFHATLPSTSIQKIERIQNLDLWDDFITQKLKMERSKDGAVEKLLFHGTKHSQIDAISRQGFDFRLSGTRVGTLYGNGSYFAVNSAYSDKYTTNDDQNIAKMFLVRVLVGKYCKGEPGYVRPPAINVSDSGGKLYDSCVNNIENPGIFVIFQNNQCYPEYVITYYKKHF